MRKVKSGQKYKHFKGKIVEVLMLAKDSETLDDVVVYKEENGSIWIRNKEMFLSVVDHKKYPDIKQKYRFEEITID